MGLECRPGDRVVWVRILLRNFGNYPTLLFMFECLPEDIGLYRDVWIAAIAHPERVWRPERRQSICDRFQGRRVRHEYVTMHITFLTRKSALIYRRGLRQRVASLTLDGNGVFAIRAYKAVGPFYRSGVYAGESKISHKGAKCVTCRGLHRP